MSETALARQVPTAGLTRWRMLPGSLGEAMEMATMIANSELCPKAYRGKPADCIICYEYGSALGLSWMQSLRSVSVINGQGALWGDAVPALIMGSGECERFHEFYEGDEKTDDFTAVCLMRRKGLPDEVKRTFSVKDAKAAGLWTKGGPWQQYPKRMLQMRARGFAARDTFADKLSGLILAEEAMDYPDAIDSTAVSVEEVRNAPVDQMERIPEALRDNVEKAFTTLNFAPGQRLAKLNEFLGKEGVTPEEGATALLEWCKDEYSKRKTGQPRKSNNKPKAPEKPAEPPAPVVTTPPIADGEVVEPKPLPTTVPADSIPWGNQGQKPNSELF